MGFLDTLYGLGNLNPEQSQGLLAAAASLLKSGGPSRIPVSTGQALGDAIGAFQGGVDAATQLKQQRALQQQMEQLNTIKLRDAQADFDNQQTLRDRAKKLQDFYRNDAVATGNTPSPLSTLTSLTGAAAPTVDNAAILQRIRGMQGPSAFGDIPLIGASPFMQKMATLGADAPAGGKFSAQEYFDAAAQAGLQNPSSNETLNTIVDRVNQYGETPAVAARALSGQGPRPTNDQIIQKIQNMQGPMPQLGASQRAYQQRLAQAERLRAAGFGPEADAAEDHALKFLPKVKGWEKVQQDGKVMFAPYFEDGTSGAPVPLEVAQQLEKVDTGGRVDLTNPFTGATVRSLSKSATPDAILSAATTRRGQDITDARARETNQINQGIRADTQAQKIRDENLTKQGQIAGFDTMLDSLDRLAAHPGLTQSVGLYSKVPTIPGSDSANFQAELETFKSQAFLPQVAQLKGMGALSDAEGRKLTAAVGALDPSMSESAFRTSIARIKDTMDAARARVVASSRSDVQQGVSPAPQQQQRKSVLRGQVIDGYRFKGGDPSQEINWEKL